MKRPPFIAEKLLLITAPPRDRESIAGDLREELADGAGYSWYWRQALGSSARFAYQRSKMTGLAVIAGHLLMAAIITSASLFVASAAFDLISGFFIAVAGGWIAAWIKRGAERALLAFSVLMGLLSMAVAWEQAPLWYHSALILVMAPGVLLGGYFERRRSRS